MNGTADVASGTDGDDDAPSRVLGGLTAVVLIAVGVLHVIWIFSPWPMDNTADFARVVVGVSEDELPSGPMTLGVVIPLFIAAWSVLVSSGWLPVTGPRWIPLWAVFGAAAVLLLRGVEGLLLSGATTLGMVDISTPAAFLRADLVIYSPLCLLLGAGLGVVWWRGRSGLR
jgi:hypothetical protein